MSRPTRRQVLAGGAGVLGTGAVGWQTVPGPTRLAMRRRLGVAPAPYIPEAPEGRVRLERVRSESMGEIDLFSAVPAGFGDGSGLPVVVVLHGASASAADLRGFGLGRFVSAAVRAGTPPFVLAGTDDGPAGWVPGGGIDPQAMLAKELPGWLGDPLMDDPEMLSALSGRRWGLWCGENDPFRDGAEALARAAPVAPDPDVAGPGAHTRYYWNDHTLAMLDLAVRNLPEPRAAGRGSTTGRAR